MTIADTTEGKVEGTAEHGLHRFPGIPYAAPVSGSGRLLPPKPATPWTGVPAPRWRG